MPRTTANIAASQGSARGHQNLDRKPASTACLSCRSARVKCRRIDTDEAAPCTRCQGLAQPCQFQPSQRGRRFTRQISDLWQELERVCRMTSELTDLFTPTQSVKDTSMAVTSTESLDNIRRTLGSAQETLDELVNHRPKTSSAATNIVIASTSKSRIQQSIGTEIGVVLRDRKSVLHKSFQSQQRPSASTSNGSEPRAHPLDTFAQIACSRRTEASDNVAALPGSHLQEGAGTEVSWVPECVRSLLKEDDVDELFSIYFTKMSRHCRIFSPSQADPRNVANVSTFLLISICCAACNHHPRRADWQKKLCELVMEHWLSITKNGIASIEIVQALLLISAWSPPLGSEDRSWQLLGQAITLAIQLDLHLPPSRTLIYSADQDDNLLKRVRTWLVLYIQDRSLSAQTGRPTLLPDNTLTLDIELWYAYRPMEIGDGLYIELQHIFHHSLLSGGNNADDETAYARSPNFDSYLASWSSKAQTLLAREDLDPEERTYQASMNRFFYSYYSLIIHTLDLQTLSRRGAVDTSSIQSGCFSHASNAVTCLLDRLDQDGLLMECPESYFVFGAYCAVSLLSLASDDQQRQIAIRDVQMVIRCFTRIATSPHHAPYVYAKFLTKSLKASQKVTARPASNEHGNKGIALRDARASSLSQQTALLDDLLAQDLFQGYTNDTYNLLPGYGNELFDFLAQQMW